MWWTALGFLAVTGASVWWHMRTSARGGTTTHATCPRCGAAVPPGALFCRNCRAPMQVFELVSAPTADGEAVGTSGDP
jgi:uncharacterized OB-fold protein